jgi:hypothetical protein
MPVSLASLRSSSTAAGVDGGGSPCSARLPQAQPGKRHESLYADNYRP